jgi:hypothetical protein
LPTLDELMASGLDRDQAVQRLLAASREQGPVGHVLTLRAEVEGTVLAPALQALLAGWRALGIEAVPLRDYATGLELSRLPRRVVDDDTAGARGSIAVEGKEFLADSVPSAE